MQIFGGEALRLEEVTRKVATDLPKSTSNNLIVLRYTQAADDVATSSSRRRTRFASHLTTSCHRSDVASQLECFSLRTRNSQHQCSLLLNGMEAALSLKVGLSWCQQQRWLPLFSSFDRANILSRLARDRGSFSMAVVFRHTRVHTQFSSTAHQKRFNSHILTDCSFAKSLQHITLSQLHVENDKAA
jgi:hypothetical protein